MHKRPPGITAGLYCLTSACVYNTCTCLQAAQVHLLLQHHPTPPHPRHASTAVRHCSQQAHTCRRHRSTSFFSITSAWCALRAGRAGEGSTALGRRWGHVGRSECVPAGHSQTQSRAAQGPALTAPAATSASSPPRRTPQTRAPTASQAAAGRGHPPLRHAERLQHGLQAGAVAGGEAGRQVSQAGQVVEVGAKLRYRGTGGGRRYRRRQTRDAGRGRPGQAAGRASGHQAVQRSRRHPNPRQAHPHSHSRRLPG